MNLPAHRRVEVLDDVLDMLARAAAHIESDTRVIGLPRGRALTAVATVALRAVEIKEVADRLEAVEAALKLRQAVP